MEASPLISIIIPTYNDADVVCDAIDCSLNQTYPNIEVIVVDDGSRDGTEELLQEKYGDKINYIRQENKGLSSARNRGIHHSSGKYLQFLDSDDLIDKNKLTIQLEQLKYIKGLAVAYCDYIRTAIDDMTLNCKRMSPILQKEKPFDDMIMKWETELSIPPHCFLFDAAFFRERGISFDESLPTHEDWECWMSVFACIPTVVFIDYPLANYRLRSGSMCANKLKMRNGYLMAIDKQILKNKGNSDVVAKLKLRKKQIKHLYWETSPLMRFMGKCHPLVKKTFCAVVPWRIQRILD